MPQENLLSIQQYATRHKMSTFAVIKLVNAKKVDVVKKEIDGEIKEFIVDKSVSCVSNIQPQIIKEETSEINYEVEFHKLFSKYVELQEKYHALLEKTNH